ncbi:calcium-binding protein [Paenibacillus mucilaginosus]|uniref:Haemolysin-type calcium binding-related domain-containing protein n=1 Tax=Paenibacillus mucilaginosus (strain KNP414) TaxID=1036673 RepID=F8FG56_PAEMK|nr:calcium-binding protein [Paenibacillus mucilaginosus]AEI43876.1 hypothetical protein KNP414_05352 [Paenibacillus mucilaginosus KNP414]MCG7212615.1 hypothetical protein [Paenibacillus mucilaginosus]WDM31484.1 hypothetical protein KCX80_23230 [Paenibacillus mucilaginosus]
MVRLGWGSSTLRFWRLKTNGNDGRKIDSAVEHFFDKGAYRVERFEFGSGTILTDTQVEQTVQALAPVPGGGDATEAGGPAGEAQDLLLAAGDSALIG